MHAAKSLGWNKAESQVLWNRNSCFQPFWMAVFFPRCVSDATLALTLNILQKRCMFLQSEVDCGRLISQGLLTLSLVDTCYCHNPSKRKEVRLHGLWVNIMNTPYIFVLLCGFLHLKTSHCIVKKPMGRSHREKSFSENFTNNSTDSQYHIPPI